MAITAETGGTQRTERPASQGQLSVQNDQDEADEDAITRGEVEDSRSPSF